MKFEIQKELPGALGRAGKLTVPHGVIETPAFVAVGTKATVKALTPHEIKETGAQVVLGNTYHLYLEPGEKVILQAGGLGKFMGWDGPTMTDSGGFQVFSLGANFEKGIGKIGNGEKVHSDVLKNIRMDNNEGTRKTLVRIDEDGVDFSSHRDGSRHRFTPEKSIEIQHAIGADIIFAFDECTSPEAPYAYQKEAMERTHRWALRSLTRHQQPTTNNQQVLFGIVQGGRFEDLRKESARTIGKMNFDGFGIGGSFDKSDMGAAVRWVNELLPKEKPRHLLGIGDPLDLFGAVENGCDLFDCVAPTRNARTGSLYTKHGRFNIENTKYKTDFTSIEKGCGCYTCENFTKSYLCHLFRAKEMLAATLASIHNVYFIVHLAENIRKAILEGRFAQTKDEFLRHYT